MKSEDKDAGEVDAGLYDWDSKSREGREPPDTAGCVVGHCEGIFREKMPN